MNTYRTLVWKIAFFLVLFSSSPASMAMNLSNGGVVTGNIDFIGEVDEFTFTASAGHTAYLRVADTESAQSVSSPFSPRIELIDPNGALLTSSSGALVGDIARFLVINGTYTVRVMDSSFGNDETGSYNLFYARAPGANDDGFLQNGERTSGEITLGDIDSYRFTANAGETVYLRAADTDSTQFVSADFTPAVLLLGPSGALITSATGALVADVARALTVTGTYTVLVLDESQGEDATGNYDLYFAKAPGASDNGVLQNGRRTSSEIDLGDIDSYRFNANAGETVYLRAADTDSTEFVSSPFTPAVLLLSPTGALITSATGALVADVSRALTQTGTYTVLVMDESFGEDATGNYDLYFARAPGANNNGFLQNGEVASGEIDLGDIDSYRFSANAGETVYLRAADTDSTQFVSSDFTPAVLLLSPSGSLITSATGSLVADVSRTLTETGTYTVLLVDESSGEDATGSYNLYYAKAPGAMDNGCLANGENQFDSIDLGDIDSYYFQADAGTSLSVSVADLDGGGFSPAVILLSSTGAVITSDVDSTVAQFTRTLTASGMYTLIVLDESFGEDATGNYRIDVSGVSVTCPQPTTPTAEVQLVHSCLAGNGRFDVNIVNTQTALSTYTFNLQGQSPRTRSIPFEGWGRIPITGRLPGSFTAEVLRDGVQIVNETIQVDCDTQSPTVSSPEVSIVNACVGGNGFVLFQMVNPTGSSRPYVIEFDNVPNRSTTAAAYGQAVRGTSGRPDGIYSYRVRTGSTTVKEGAVEVDCD